MGAGGAAGLLLVMLLVVPGTRAGYCRKEEYSDDKGHCCLLCPAGTYVAQHCSASHLRGTCLSCTEGESYTAHENGLEECLFCRQCKDDQVTVRPCTRTRDTECQCKQGHFCPDEGCEMCQTCSTKCPEGQEIVQNCNTTTDLECGFPSQDQGSTALACVAVVAVIGIAIISVLMLVIRKLKSGKAASTDKDAERGLETKDSTENLISPQVEEPANNAADPESENPGESPEGQVQTNVDLEVKNTSLEENSAGPSAQGTVLCGSWRHCVEGCCRSIAESSLPAKTGQNPAFRKNATSNAPSGRMPGNHTVQEPKYRIIVKDLSQKELSNTFGAFIKEVPPEKWEQFMLTHLTKNYIAEISHNFPLDIEEQSYQMLLAWKNTLGEKQSIVKLLDNLRGVDIKAYYNIFKTLKSNNIISELEATD